MYRFFSQTRKIVAVLLLAGLLLLALALSGFSVAAYSQDAGQAALSPAFQRLNNVIVNGDFEIFPGTADVATYWQIFNNGSGHFLYYDEMWDEAVHSGQHSQLMEIWLVEGSQPDWAMAIHQTVDVAPNAYYLLTIHALMRSEAPQADRNQGEYAMDWGIDYQGRGDYYNVQTWHSMSMTEQVRRGSAALDLADARHLFFEQITATVFTTNTGRLTLFIRGLKLEPTGTEVNFNVDDVSLVGPYYPPPPPSPTAGPTVIVTPVADLATPAAVVPATTPPPASDDNLPDAGASPPPRSSPGVLLAAGLMLAALSAGGVLFSRRK